MKALETSMDMINGTSNTVIISNELGYGLSNESIKTKRCCRCGKILPITEFNKNKSAKDGLQRECRSCHAISMKSYIIKKANSIVSSKKSEANDKNLSKVYSNADLAKFTPRQLMEELKARGFKWEYMLEPQKKIYFDKI